MTILASFGETLIAVLIGFLALLLIGLVLLQKNRGSGLSGAFGGVGGHSAFGTKTGDFLTWVTVGVTAAFLLLCVIGNFVFVPDFTAQAGQPTQAPAGQAPMTPQPQPGGAGAPRPAAPAQSTAVPAQNPAAPAAKPATPPATPPAGTSGGAQPADGKTP